MDDDDASEGSTDVSYNNDSNNSDEDAAPLTDYELKVNLENLVKQQINSPSFHTSISGVESLYYQDSQSGFTLSGGGETVNLKGSSDFPLYASMLLVVGALVGMVGVGSLMRKYQADKDGGHHRLEDQDERELPIADVDSIGDEDLNSSYWSRGWENVTRSYEYAVEVCMEKTRSFRNEI